MYETLKRLWIEGKLTIAALDNAIRLGWITIEQANIIRATEI